MRKSTVRSSLMWAAGRLARWTGLVGLNYLRIGDGRQSPFDRGLWSATAEAFDEQLAWIKKNYDVVSPADLPAAKSGRRVIITFDDGYRDNYTAAFPVLQRHGLPATFFVATGFIDEPRLPWWDEIAWMVRSSKRTGLTRNFAGASHSPHRPKARLRSAIDARIAVASP